jgi:FixJ family two-component response regulator
MISIIDDDYWAREGIRELIESLGYKARAFTSVEEFLQSGLLAETACVITDLQMPGLSGFDLQDQLQAQGISTPIIIITAYPDEKRRARALACGAVGFLNKPFDECSLIDCLSDALGRKTLIHDVVKH